MSLITPVMGIPKTKARLKWAATLHVGLDLEDILGLTPSTVNLAATLGAANNLSEKAKNALFKPFGAVESFEFGQSSQVYERYALGPNSIQAFQTIQQRITNVLKLQKTVLKVLQDAERVFNFFPNNIAHQQLPFVVMLTDAGDGVDPNTQITHLFFGCQFADLNVKYSTLEKEDQKLIQTATVRASRVLSLDASFAGNPAVQAASEIAGGILSIPQVSQEIENLDLF